MKFLVQLSEIKIDFLLEYTNTHKRNSKIFLANITKKFYFKAIKIKRVDIEFGLLEQVQLTLEKF